MATSESPPTTHLPYLDGVRGVAALYVCFHHLFLQIYGVRDNKATFFLEPFLTDWLYYGHFAVSLFIVLSGFCLFLPVIRNEGILKGGGKTFFKRRSWRILPAYYAAVLFSLVMIWGFVGNKTGTHWDMSVPVTGKDIWVHLFLLQDVLLSSQINHTHWSVALECHIYLLFPLLILLWNRFGGLRVVVAGTVLAFLASILNDLFDKSHVFNIHFVGLFIIGMASAYIAFSPNHKARQWRELPQWPHITLLSFVLVCASCATVGHDKAFKYLHYLDIPFGIASGAFLIWLTKGTKVARFFSWRPLVFLGTFAYSLYLIHAPLIQFVWELTVQGRNFNTWVGFLTLTGFALPVMLLTSYLFFLCFERPFLRRK